MFSRAPVDIPLFIIFLGYSLISIQGVLFTEYMLYQKLNVSIDTEDVAVINDIQALMANWTTIFLVCQSLPAIFVTMFVSTWTDRIGRKIAIVLPTLGYLVATINYIVVFVYNLPIESLIIGNLAIGCTGSVFLLRSGVASFVSDQLTNDQLTSRMSILLGVATFGFAIGQLMFSLWIEAKEFTQPFTFMAVLLTISIAYIIFIMKESVSYNRTKQPNKILVDMANVVLINKNNRRSLLICLLLSRFIFSVVFNGLFQGAQLYLLGPPHFMTTTGAGYFLFSFSLSNTFGTMFITKLCHRCGNTSDYALFYLGSISAMASSLVIAVSTSAIIYLAVPLGVLAVLPKAVVEAQLSKLVDKNEIGAIFAQAGVLDNLGFLLAPIWSGVTYAATVQTVPSLIFYIMFVGALANMILVIFIQVKFEWDETLMMSYKSEEECTNEETPLVMSSLHNNNH